MEKISFNWITYDKYDSYECSYCLVTVSPYKVWIAKNSFKSAYDIPYSISSYLYFCNHCGRPTFKDGLQNNELFPKKIYGKKIELPERYKEIKEAFEELRKCISVNAFTAAVMMGRKILTIITYNYPETSNEIKKKIESGQIKFFECVVELKKIYALPAINHHLFDKIKNLGNDANHQLEQRSEKDAKEIYEAIELIMKTFEKAEDKDESLNKIENK